MPGHWCGGRRGFEQRTRGLGVQKHARRACIPGERAGFLGEQQSLASAVHGELITQPQQRDRRHRVDGRCRPSAGTAERRHRTGAGVECTFKQCFRKRRGQRMAAADHLDAGWRRLLEGETQ